MYRTIDCDIWDDPWIQDLDPLAKLLFIYLFTNRRATACGVFEITIRTITFETGLDSAQIRDILPTLAPKIQWWADLQTVWVVNFYRRQRANSNDKFQTSAQRALQTFPHDVQETVLAVYPELVPSNGTPTPPRGTGRDMTPTHIPLVSHANGITEGSPSHTNKETVTEQNRTEIPPTPQTEPPPEPMPANAGGAGSPKLDKGRKPRTNKPPSVAGWGYPLLWQLVTEQQGYAPDWNYAVQTDAVNRILAKHPTEQPGDLARFLAYKATCYRADPHSQPTFSAYEADYAGWVRAGKPPRVEKEPGAGAGRGASHLFSVTGQPYRLVDKGA